MKYENPGFYKELFYHIDIFQLHEKLNEIFDEQEQGMALEVKDEDHEPVRYNFEHVTFFKSICEVLLQDNAEKLEEQQPKDIQE